MLYIGFVVRNNPPDSPTYASRVKVRCPALHGLDPNAPDNNFNNDILSYTPAENLPWVSVPYGETYDVGDELYIDVQDEGRSMLVHGLARPVSITGLQNGGAIFVKEE